jgi:hypothetical protein
VRSVNRNELWYRYLLEPAWATGGRFADLLKECSVTLPAVLPLADMVDLGWLQPRCRIVLPSRYIKEWPNFPCLGMARPVPAEHEWADYLAACWGTSPGWASRGALTGDWFEHPFDAKKDASDIELWRHVIMTGPGARRPRRVRKEGFTKGVRPWVDAFGYWQAYEVADLLDAAELSGPIWNSKTVRGSVGALKKGLKELVRWSDRSRQVQHDKWQQRENAFDWLSRYRTLQGVWARSLTESEALHEGTKRFIAVQGITADRIRNDLRMVFVRVFRETENRPGLHELARQDVFCAADLLSNLPGKAFDRRDPLWEQLGLFDNILPFESQVARTHFEKRAHSYIQHFPSVKGGAYDADRFGALTERWWTASTQFRRFCRAYDRLHRDLGSGANEERRVWLTDNTPTDHFLLCTLVVEKLLAERHEERTRQKNSPSFHRLIKETVSRVERDAGISGACDELMTDWKDRTALYDLLASPQNPLSPFPEPLNAKDTIVTAFRNFGILRNYFAHHDVLIRTSQACWSAVKVWPRAMAWKVRATRSSAVRSGSCSWTACFTMEIRSTRGFWYTA